MTQKINNYILVLLVLTKSLNSAFSADPKLYKNPLVNNKNSLDSLIISEEEIIDNQEEFDLEKFNKLLEPERFEYYLSLIKFVKDYNDKQNFFIIFDLEQLYFQNGELKIRIENNNLKTFNQPINNLNNEELKKIHYGYFFYEQIKAQVKYDIYGLIYMIGIIENKGINPFKKEVKLNEIVGSDIFSDEIESENCLDKRDPHILCLINVLKGFVKNKDKLNELFENEYKINIESNKNKKKHLLRYFHKRYIFNCEYGNLDCLYINCLQFKSGNIPSYEELLNYMNKILGKNILI